MPTWMRCWPSRASCRRRSTPTTAGTWTHAWSRPWTPCAALTLTPRWGCCPVASAGAWPSADCSCRSPTSCCWTSPPTTWTPRRSPGWRSTCRTTPAPSSPSPTTAISWTTWRAGSWSWTAARAFPGRATTPAGWSRSRAAWPRRRSPTSGARRPWSGSWSGSACRPRVSTRRARPASPTTKAWRAKRDARRSRSWRSTSPAARAWVTWWPRWMASPRSTATGCCLRT